MLKYFLLRILWWNDVKRHIATWKHSGRSNKHIATNSNRNTRKKTIASILILVASLLLSLASFLSRKRADSLIDILFMSAMVLQMIAMATLITTLRGGERHIHRPFF